MQIALAFDRHLPQFYPAAWGADDRNERSSGRRLHAKVESKSTQGFLNLFRVRMFPAQADQRSPLSGRTGRMRRRPPIDEERNNPAGYDRARIRVAPEENNAVRSLSTPRDHLPQLHPATSGFAGQMLKFLSLGCPRHEPRFLEIIDAERTRLRWGRLFRIGANDLQVGSWTE